MSKLTPEQIFQNTARANRVSHVLALYKAHELGEDGPVDKDTFVDLLSDMRHYADHENIDFYLVLGVSNNHYLAEKNGDE